MFRKTLLAGLKIKSNRLAQTPKHRSPPRLAPRFGKKGIEFLAKEAPPKKKPEENWQKIDARVGGAGREASSYQGDHPTHPIRPEVGRLLGIRVLGGHS